MYYTYVDTSVGNLLLMSDGQHITGMHWVVFKRAPKPDKSWVDRPGIFNHVTTQLNEYFNGRRKTFDLRYTLAGTAFQRAVWKELERIPYGKTTTYQAIAKAIGNPRAVRAVGTAVGSNPISIVIPCHRVIATNGTLGGYAGGLESKKLLLGIESAVYRTK